MTNKDRDCYADRVFASTASAERTRLPLQPHETIDAHHHLWRYTPEEYGWIGDAMQVLRCDFLLPELHSALQAAGVGGTVAVQARQTREETDWLLALAAEPASPIRGVVGWLPIAADDFAATLERYASLPALKGLRHVVQAEPKGFLAREDFCRGMQSLQGTSLTYDLLVYAPQLAEATRFVDRFPNQQFILDHVGKPDIRGGEIDAWTQAIKELARRENVACKLSGMVTEADYDTWSEAQLSPYVDVVLQAFGARRVMAGSDWPVLTVACDYARWWSLVRGWVGSLSADEQARVLGGTATEWYRLTCAGGDLR